MREMERFRSSAARVIAAMTCALLAVLACAMPRAFAASAPADKVGASVEAQTAGQGCIVEPAVVTFDEFIGYRSERGQGISPDQVTAGGVIACALERNGAPVAGGTTATGSAYLATVTGADKGRCAPPQHIRGALREEGVDISEPYAQRAVLDGAGCFEADPAARTAAPGVMENLLAIQEQVDAACAELRDGAVAAPVITVDLPGDTVTCSEGDVPAASVGELGYEWFSSSDGKAWGRTGETGSSLLPPAAKMGATLCKCVVTATDPAMGLTASAESSVATVAVGIDSPEFTGDLPEDEIVRLKADLPAELRVEARVPESGTIDYQWFESADRTERTAVERSCDPTALGDL